jgi:Leucine-rich repeat (LRR) protein
MFRILLWIILWLSVGFVDLISSEINLNCYYFEYIEYYACQVFGKSMLNESEEISFSGVHLSGKSDDSVTMLAFYETTMYYMPTNLFSKFNNIQKFHCDRCSVKKIEKANFKQAGNLKNLKLPVGSIETLENDLFYFCDKLENIELQANHISKIEEKSLSGLRNLKSLFLNHNHIESLKKGTFDDLLSLEILALRNNKIENVVANLLEFNTNLKEINLKYNRITVIDPNLIDHLEKLTFIDFRFNDCGDREDFYDNRPAKMKSTFNQYAPQCTEENRLEYKLHKNIETLEDKKLENKRCTSEVTQQTKTIQALNAEIKKLSPAQDKKLTEKSENGKQTQTMIEKVKMVISQNLDIFLIDVVSMNFLALILICWTFFIIWKYKRVF